MLISEAKRPVLIVGAGVRLAGAVDLAREFSKRMQIPVAPTWAMLDAFDSDDPLTIGSFGTHGTRYGNFAVQNADYILSVGSRLDTKATGTPVNTFARGAEKTMVDIDYAELNKFPAMERVHQDARAFFEQVEGWNLAPPDTRDWLTQIEYWKAKYANPQDGPYALIRAISAHCRPDEVIVTDTGCTVAWMAQCFNFRHGQRFLHAWNQTPMGWGLPGAIGAHYATGKRVVLTSGDGSFMMSAQELATVAGRRLPIKMFIFNNKGHAMCRQTQREWLGAEYPATSIEGGLSFPDFVRMAQGFGVPAFLGDINPKFYIDDTLCHDGPSLVEFTLDADAEVFPKVKYGYPNEDGHPLLPWSEFQNQMIVAPLPRPEG